MTDHECKPWWDTGTHAKRRAGEASWDAARARGLKRVGKRLRGPGTYPLTPDEFITMLRAQGWACALCRRTPDVALVQDHDHSTGLVRGLLCHACNTGMGKLGDDPEMLERAAAYLRGQL